jgi:hypothetical protein
VEAAEGSFGRQSLCKQRKGLGLLMLIAACKSQAHVRCKHACECDNLGSVLLVQYRFVLQISIEQMDSLVRWFLWW